MRRQIVYRGPETGCPHEAAHVLESGDARSVPKEFVGDDIATEYSDLIGLLR